MRKAIITAAGIFLCCGEIKKADLTFRDPSEAFSNPGVSVSPTQGLLTSESGSATTFLVRLKTKPKSDVQIPLTSDNITEGKILSGGSLMVAGDESSRRLTFTSADWDTQQIVVMQGQNDFVQDGAVAYKAVLGNVISQDAVYSGINPDDVSITNADNDTIGVTFSATSGLISHESGVAAIFTVILNTQPTADVVFSLTSSNTAEGQIDQTSGNCDAGGAKATTACNLTFTSSNWNTPQSVRVEGIDDLTTDGNIAYQIVTGAATSTDTSYNGLNPADISLTNNDNDTPGITVSPTSITTTEAGGTAIFNIRLNAGPNAGATVRISMSTSSAAEGRLTETSAGSGVCADSGTNYVNTCYVDFTSANWSSNYPIQVKGSDDFVDDGNISYNIVTAAATIPAGTDTNYNGMNAADVTASNTDNDTAAVTVNNISGNTTEAGGNATFTMRLESQPSADVDLTINGSNDGEGRLSRTGGFCDNSATIAAGSCTVRFTSVNWSTLQTIRVTGQDDSVIDGNVSYNITISNATSTDGLYSNKIPSQTSLSLSNTDNDTASVIITPTSGLLTKEDGTSATFTARLGAQPAADVTFSLSSSSESEGRLNASGGVCDNGTTTITGNCSLTFTAANWNTNQTVKITGIDDFVADTSQAYAIVTANTVSTDANFNNLNPSDISVINQDPNYKRIFVTATSYDGNLGGVGGADTKCSSAGNKPATGTYKALISVGATRRATVTANIGDGQADWVLAANMSYYRASDAAFIGNTNGVKLFTFPTTNSIANGVSAWTPFLSGWRNYDTASSPYTSCDGFLTNSSARYSGYSCDSAGTGANQVLGCDIQCNNLRSIICVEQ